MVILMEKSKISIRELLKNKNTGSLSLIAGHSYSNNLVSSIHIIESVNDIQPLLDYQLVYLSVYSKEVDALDLIELVSICKKNNASGVIIRSSTLDDALLNKLIFFCNRENFPLLTLGPFNSLSDVLYELEYFLFSLESKNKQLFHVIKDAVSFPEKTDRYFPILKSFGFREEDDYTIGIVEMEKSILKKIRKVSNLVLSIESLLLKTGDKSFVLRIDNQLIILLSQYNTVNIIDAFDKIENILDSYSVQYFGACGDRFMGMNNIGESFSQAKKIISLSQKRNMKNKIILFSQLELERFVLSTTDLSVYQTVYENTLGKLTAYDRANDSNFKELLDAYLDNNCNIQNTSKLLYLHRNTASYQLKKIEEILDIDLNDETVRAKLYLAQTYERIEDP